MDSHRCFNWFISFFVIFISSFAYKYLRGDELISFNNSSLFVITLFIIFSSISFLLANVLCKYLVPNNLPSLVFGHVLKRNIFSSLVKFFLEPYNNLVIVLVNKILQ